MDCNMPHIADHWIQFGEHNSGFKSKIKTSNF